MTLSRIKFILEHSIFPITFAVVSFRLRVSSLAYVQCRRPFQMQLELGKSVQASNIHLCKKEVQKIQVCTLHI